MSTRRAAVPAVADLFTRVSDLKPTARKWMVCSKVLYHLLPDLVVPMDNQYTAPFFGRSGLPIGLSKDFFVEAYSAFAAIAAGQDHLLQELAQRCSPRLGLGRVIDFAVVGSQLSAERGAR